MPLIEILHTRPFLFCFLAGLLRSLTGRFRLRLLFAPGIMLSHGQRLWNRRCHRMVA